jgi:flagellar biogenesis protein FliO
VYGGFVSATVSYVVQALLTLLGVALLGALLVYAARRSTGPHRPGPLSLAARLPLDGRRAVYLIRAADKLFIVAIGESGIAKLGELAADSLPHAELEPPGFAETLRLALARRRASEAAASQPPVEPGQQ